MSSHLLLLSGVSPFDTSAMGELREDICASAIKVPVGGEPGANAQTRGSQNILCDT